MHVISGRFKGMALAPAKAGTRPTTDRTKEALFSRLDSRGMLEDARVLDLFAGTGALGIEAISRGARALLGVESSGPAAALINSTLKKLQHSKSWDASIQTQVVKQRAEQFVSGYAGPAFDVIFIDPPYAFATEDCNMLLADLAGGATTDRNSVIILERSTRSTSPTPAQGWEITDERAYGETAVFTLETVE
jgi:16S rRNA (guanine966-N2)-methyltransferase